MSFSEKTYRFLLRAYPREFRDRYAQSMEQLFRDRLREARTLPALARLWGGTLMDWAVTVPARYGERMPHLQHRAAFSDAGRRCLFFARSEASSFSRREITVEHLLLGVLREEPSLVSGTAREAVMRAIEASEPAGRRDPPMEELRVSDRARLVIRAANQRAHAAGRQQSSPADLFAAISREARDSLAGRLLREHSA